MKNYYEILEININASKEVIDKVYRTLAKKYHPDTNSNEDKKWAEEKFKEINEAYEVLSDEEKRKEYDMKLKSDRDTTDKELENLKEMYREMIKQNIMLRNQVKILRSDNYKESNRAANNQDFKNNFDNRYYQSVQDSINRAYHDAYIQRMKDYGYKIIYKKTIKERIKDFLSILVTIEIVAVILIFLWQIPPIREYIKEVLFWI